MAESLKNAAISGVTWKTIEKFSNYGIQFCISIVLARLLSPADYGTVGLLAIFFALAGLFKDCGFGSALIQKKNATQADYSTVFIYNVVSSVVIYAILFFSAPLIAKFYSLPILTPIVRVSAISFIIGGLTGVQYTKLTKELKFKTLSILSIISVIVTGTAGIIMAYYGWGVWALVFQGLVSSILMGVVVWILSGWHPTLEFSKDSFRSLFSFGSKLLGSNIINTIYNNLYTLVIGKVFNPATVGYYNRANGYAQLPTDTVMQLSLSISYPLLAKVSDNDSRLLNAYKKLLRTPLFALYPILTLLIVVAHPLIEVMIGAKWLPCAPMLQILCFRGFVFPLSHTNLNLLYVKGRSDLVLKLELMKKPIAFAILFATIPFGIIPMVTGCAAYSFVAFTFNCYYTKKFLNYGLKRQIAELMPIIVNCLAAAIVAYLCMHLFTANLLQVLVGVLSGGITFILLSYLRKDESFIEIRGILAERWHRVKHT